MRQTPVLAAAFVLVSILLLAQPPTAPQSDEDKSPRMKRSQIEELLKADREKSLEDATQLIKLSEDLKIELEKNDKHVVSMTAIKKTEEIEKLAKRIRGRMRRY